MSARILIIDEFEPTARLMEARLAREYYEVRLAFDPGTVVDMARDWRPDVIILDVMTTLTDGYALCRRLKIEPATAHVPVMIVTGLESSAERREGLRCGADEFLTKPVEYELLVARLRGIVRLKRVRDEWRKREATAAVLGLTGDPQAGGAPPQARVLVVDNLSNRAARISAALQDGCTSAVPAADIDAALRLAECERFDLVIISLSLLDGDPLRLVARLRADSERQDTPVLLVAERQQHQDLIAGLDLGANDGLFLPIDDSELQLRARHQIRQKQLHDRLRRDIDQALLLSVIDPLTQAYNRRYFDSYLEQACRGEPECRLSVLLIDIDHFKAINDGLGHLAGDAVLREVAGVLRRNLRQSDLLARYGGEEFVVILADHSGEREAHVVAEKLRAAVAASGFDGGAAVTVSIGFATGCPPLVAPVVIDAADQALYEAKRLGRNRVISARWLPQEGAREASPTASAAGSISEPSGAISSAARSVT